MSVVNPAAPACAILSGRARVRLGDLQGRVHERYVRRCAALRLLLASRQAATSPGQRDFWLEFASAHLEYRISVRRLAQFCAEHREPPRRSLRSRWRAPTSVVLKGSSSG